MTGTLDLQKIEKKTYRTIYQDGLLDINMGGNLLCMAILASSLVNDTLSLVRLGFWVIGIALFSLIYWAGKKYLTAPRLGRVKFGPQRQKRNRVMTLILACIVVLQVTILLGTVLLLRNPQWAASLRISSSGDDLERLLVAIVASLFVGPSTFLIAYFTDFPRGYYISLIMTVAVFLFVWFWQAIYLIIGGLLIMIPGIYLLTRFLQAYPIPPVENIDD